MKLRLRSLESKETLRIEVPEPCTLQHLKDTLIRTLSYSSSAASLRFSLNRKDDLQGSSPEDPLQSMGITSGDLVFYTFNPSGFSSENVASIRTSQSRAPGASVRGTSPPQPQVDHSALPKHIQGGDCDLKKPKVDNCYIVEHPESMGSESVVANMITSGIEEGEENLDSDGEEMDINDESIEMKEKMCSKPTFLRRVLKEELGYDRNAHKLLVTAAHAVLLESGFVLIDPNLGGKDHPFHIPADWPSPSFTMSLWYSLPELLVEGSKSAAMTGIVLLKFQSLGHFVNVYGSLGCSRGSCVYRVSLDENKFAPNLDLIWANSESSYIMDETEGYPERQVFEFWKVVKDALALPLLVDLCEKTGLPPPASFRRLPADLKLKILEVLPGVDIGRLECVCTELRYLASSNDLWKLKCNQEFGCKEATQGNRHWKERYVACLEDKKLSGREMTRWRGPNLRRPYRPAALRRRPSPFAIPHVLGGDYDMVPGVRLPTFGLPGQGSSRVSRRDGFVPNCGFGRI